ncbi:MAG: ABC transporter ATP-binding protein, partial [Huintestinicola sp.]
ELSLLCTDYIFIRGGEIKRTLTAEELKKECAECYHIHTDNDSLALAVLTQKLGISRFDVDKDGSIRVYEKLDELHTISKTLYENGVIPVGLSVQEANLEQYYMNIVGGDDNVEHSESTELSDKA